MSACPSIQSTPVRSLAKVGRMLYLSGTALKPLPAWRVQRIERRALAKLRCAFDRMYPQENSN